MNKLASVVFICMLLCLSAVTSAQTGSPGEQFKKLADTQQWNELVRVLSSVESRSAEADFYYGIALAHLERLSEAEQTLKEGQQQAPADARFPIELAGIAYKQRRNTEAESLLHKALRLTPADEYANDFLATLYFLDGNLEAALKYWNRLNKPRVANVNADPQPRILATLLDRALAFAPATTLLASQLLDTNARLGALGVFPQYKIELYARKDGQYDATLRARERNGTGDGLWESLFYFLRGIPFQQVSPSYYNLHHEAINFDSIVRWDAQKRRMFAELSGPLRHSAKLRWEMQADLRNENWSLRDGFTGPAPVQASFNLRSAVGRVDVASYTSGRYGWGVGAEVSHRQFSSLSPGSSLNSQIFSAGYELKQTAEFSGSLWRRPEHRFVLIGGAKNETARFWSATPQVFDKLRGQLGWQWSPHARGEDYVTAQQLRIGKIFGTAPFDELYILGLERDNDLPMRAHIGTRDGRKGSAPIGSEYILQNWELDKILYSNWLVSLKLGPFVDLGKISNSDPALGSQKWLVDVGAQFEFAVLGSGLIFSYGKDLRTGNNAFYLRLLER